MFGLTKDDKCKVCGLANSKHRGFQRKELSSTPKLPELMEIEGEDWVICLRPVSYFVTVYYGVPVADADPELSQRLKRNTMTRDEFAELYQ